MAASWVVANLVRGCDVRFHRREWGRDTRAVMHHQRQDASHACCWHVDLVYSAAPPPTSIHSLHAGHVFKVRERKTKTILAMKVMLKQEIKVCWCCMWGCAQSRMRSCIQLHPPGWSPRPTGH